MLEIFYYFTKSRVDKMRTYYIFMYTSVYIVEIAKSELFSSYF